MLYPLDRWSQVGPSFIKNEDAEKQSVLKGYRGLIIQGRSGRDLPEFSAA
jgi:hypothetical protein